MEKRGIEIELPSLEPSLTEYHLNASEVSALDYLTIARSIAAGREGVNLRSEILTRDPKFGTIFRYESKSLAPYEKSFHPEDGFGNNKYTLYAKLIIFTVDGKHFKTVSFPSLVLPFSEKNP